ncbi:unnamed protein product [Rhodiola kirilowii]
MAASALPTPLSSPPPPPLRLPSFSSEYFSRSPSSSHSQETTFDTSQAVAVV